MTNDSPAIPTHAPRRLPRWMLVAAVTALAVLDLALYGSFSTPPGRFRLVMRSTVSSRVRVFFDVGYGFSNDLSVFAWVTASPEAQTFYFSLPSAPVKRLRIDPLERAGTVNIHSLSVRHEPGQRDLRAFDLESVVGRNEIESITSNLEGLEVVTQPGAHHPQLDLTLASPIDLTPTPLARVIVLVLVDCFAFGAIYAALWYLLYGLPRPPPFLAGSWQWLGRVGRRLRRVPIPSGWALVLLALPVGCVACFVAIEARDLYALEIVLTSDRPAVPQFYFDSGRGYLKEDSARVQVPAIKEPRAVRVPINVRTITGLRFDPSDGPVAMKVKSMTVRSTADDSAHGKPVFSFDLRTLWPVQQMTELVHEDDATIRLLVIPPAFDPATDLRLPTPLQLNLTGAHVVAQTKPFAKLWLCLWLAAWLVGRWLFRPGWLARLWAAFSRVGRQRLSPARAIWFVAAVSVVASCYPVIFCGKSFVSPNFSAGTFQLHQSNPTLPGTADRQSADGHGADLGPMAWQAVPNAVVESRALFHDWELPLWNRYDNSGVPLMGQGQSMLGDPLHWLVLLGGGRAWAWDAKFILAKWLFAAGVGLLVLVTTESLPAALLLGFSSAFIGFFAYRLNHPAYFSLCYAPWILLGWFEIARAPTWRRAMGWVGVWLLANWMVSSSGTLPEAFTALFYFNVCGLWWFVTRRPVAARFQRVLGLVAAAVILLLLSTPWLLAFSDLLKHTVVAAPPGSFRLLPAGLFIGLFDDMFYRHVAAREIVLAPSTNLLVLIGVLLAISRFKSLLGNRVFVVVLLNALLPLSVALGVLPLGVVKKLPFGDKIFEPQAVYATLLIPYLFVLAGFGLKQGMRLTALRHARRDWLVAAMAGLGLVGIYFATAGAAGLAKGLGGLPLNATGEFSPFFLKYFVLVLPAVVLLPPLLYHLRLRGPTPVTVALLAASLLLIHWRQGLQADNRFAQDTPVLPDRVDLLARSKTVKFLHADHEGPFRTVGLGAVLMPGYNAVPELEGVDGREMFVSPYVTDLKLGGMRFTDDWLHDASDKARLAATKRFYNLCNVRYYLTHPGDSLASVPGLRHIGRLDLDVYRNDEAWPRACFVDRVEAYEGFDQFRQLISEGSPKPFAAIDMSVLRQAPEAAGRFRGTRETGAVVPATGYRLTSRTTSFDVRAPHAGVILLHEAFYARTVSLEVNGRPARVFRANHAFCGTVVEAPGIYHVKATYGAPQFGLAICAALAGLLALAAAVWWLRRTPPVALVPLSAVVPLRADAPGRPSAAPSRIENR